MSSNVLGGLFRTPAPTVAVAIGSGHVTAVQLARRGRAPRLGAHARIALPAGVVTPAVTGPNIADADAVVTALEAAFGDLPRRPARVALLLPDSAAKVSLVRFANVPARRSDLRELIRWQIRKAVPFPVDDAQIACAPGRRTSDGEQEFVVAVARREVVEEYEQVCARVGAHAGLVDLEGFNLINAALLPGPVADARDWLLVHVASGASTLAVVRDGHPLLFRHVAPDGARIADLVHQTAMYYEDRLGGGELARALVTGEALVDEGSSTGGAVRRVIEERFRIAVEPLAARLTSLLPEPGAADHAALDALAAPIGILLRGRQA